MTHEELDALPWLDIKSAPKDGTIFWGKSSSGLEWYCTWLDRGKGKSCFGMAGVSLSMWNTSVELIGWKDLPS